MLFFHCCSDQDGKLKTTKEFSSNLAGFSQAADNADMSDLGSVLPPTPLFLTYQALGKQDEPEEQSLHRAEISQTSWLWQLGRPGLMLYWWMFPLHWYKASSPQTDKPSLAIFGLSNSQQNHFFQVLECIFDSSEWVSVCDHSSAGENTLQTCHWPIWLHFHVASFGDSLLFKSGGVLWLQPVLSRTVCFWAAKLFLEVCASKITWSGTKMNNSKEVLAIITALQK